MILFCALVVKLTKGILYSNYINLKLKKKYTIPKFVKMFLYWHIRTTCIY